MSLSVMTHRNFPCLSREASLEGVEELSAEGKGRAIPMVRDDCFLKKESSITLEQKQLFLKEKDKGA